MFGVETSFPHLPPPSYLPPSLLAPALLSSQLKLGLFVDKQSVTVQDPSILEGRLSVIFSIEINTGYTRWVNHKVNISKLVKKIIIPW